MRSLGSGRTDRRTLLEKCVGLLVVDVRMIEMDLDRRSLHRGIVGEGTVGLDGPLEVPGLTLVGVPFMEVESTYLGPHPVLSDPPASTSSI
jgi:hypothetical protein